jgi:hypothetical protein
VLAQLSTTLTASLIILLLARALLTRVLLLLPALGGLAIEAALSASAACQQLCSFSDSVTARLACGQHVLACRTHVPDHAAVLQKGKQRRMLWISRWHTYFL